jgi:hypothetical protein
MASASNISLKQLSGSVDKAVKAALQRNQAKSTGVILNPGILAGPLLDVATDIKVAQKIADDITAQVQKEQGSFAHAAPGAALQSGVLITHSHILCGFFPYPTPLLGLDE